MMLNYVLIIWLNLLLLSTTKRIHQLFNLYNILLST
jgi:hypothetical protein